MNPTLWSNAAPPHSAAAPTAHAMDASSAGSNASDSSTITGNDFLTLLVTEMKNQDPTSATDPNQYINQLVSVNSLQQLIQINQTLLLGLAASSSTPTGKYVPPGSPSANAQPAPGMPQGGAGRSGSEAPSVSISPGNLGVPRANPAARAVSQALSGPMHV